MTRPELPPGRCCGPPISVRRCALETVPNRSPIRARLAVARRTPTEQSARVWLSRERGVERPSAGTTGRSSRSALPFVSRLLGSDAETRSRASQALLDLEPLRPFHRAGSTAVGSVHAMRRMIQESRTGPRPPVAATGRVCVHSERGRRCATLLSIYNPGARCALHSGT